MACACSGLRQLNNQSRLEYDWIEVLQQWTATEKFILNSKACKHLLIDTPLQKIWTWKLPQYGTFKQLVIFPALCARCSPLSFFDLLLEGTCFFFKVWAWACSLHRRSWKLINFHIMKAWVRQMAASTVILIERGGKESNYKNNNKNRHRSEIHIQISSWCPFLA